MSTEPALAPPPPWPVLSPTERRILGVLVEKAKTTAESYPLSLNALVTGCNQKSNRDPILNLDEVDVEEALLSAQKKGLVMRLTGGRVERWRHYLYETWHVEKNDLAVLAELLLRGPQTEGELRSRVSRMEPFEDLEQLRAVLGPLAQRKLVVYLTPEGRRGTVFTHGFHAPDELQQLRTRHAGEAAAEEPAPARPRPAAADLETRLAETRAEVQALREQVAALQTHLGQVTEDVRRLKESLGG